MQIIRTTRAQTVDPNLTADPQTPTVDPTIPPSGVDPQSVEGFFNQDFFDTQQTPPPSPFDLLFTGASPAPGSANDAANPYSPNNVVTLEDWLVANPEGKFYINLYKDKMEGILQNRYTPELQRLQDLLNSGTLRPNEVMTVQGLVGQLQETILKMNQEIEKAQNKIDAQNQIYIQEKIEMRDLDGNGYIGDPNSDDYFIVAKNPTTGQEVILEKDGKTVAANPFLDLEYKPALVDTEDLKLIDPSQYDSLPKNQPFDVAFELKDIGRWANGGFTDNTFGAQIDVSAPEFIWVEAKDGQPKLEEGRYKPKPFEIVTREDNKQMYGQTPPPADQRDKWVAVKVTGLNISSEHVFQDDDMGKKGGFVFYVFTDKDGKELLRMRIQGVQTNSDNPLNSDGTHYVAATTVGAAVNAGLTADGEYTKHSSRVSPINVDAGNYYSTGKVLPANIFDQQSVQDFYFNELGLPDKQHGGGHVDSYGNFTGVEANSDNERTRAVRATNDTLLGGFLNPFGPVIGPLNGAYDGPDRLFHDSPIFNDDYWGSNGDGWDRIASRFGFHIDVPEEDNPSIHGSLTTMAAYLPDDTNDSEHSIKYNDLKTGVFITGLRGQITGTGNNDIIVSPGPNEEQLKKILPAGAQDIAQNMALYGTYIDASGGKNIVVSKGGDLFVRNASFLWREKDPGDTKQDQIYVDVAGKNHFGDNNPKIFVHIGDSNPEKVAIANGDDSDQTEVDKARSDHQDDPNWDPLKELPSANDDWFETPQKTQFTTLANDTPGGLTEDNGNEATVQDVKDTINNAASSIQDAILQFNKTDPMANFDPTGWDLPPDPDNAGRDAFFNQFEFFTDQKNNDFSLESLRNGHRT